MQIHNALVKHGVHEGDAGYYEALEGGIARAVPDRWATHLSAGSAMNATSAQRGAVSALVPLEAALSNRCAWQQAAARAASEPSSALRLRAGGAVLSDDATLAAHVCRNEEQRADSERRLRSARIGSARAASAFGARSRSASQPQPVSDKNGSYDNVVTLRGKTQSGRKRQPLGCDGLPVPRTLAERSRFRSADARPRVCSYAELARTRHSTSPHAPARSDALRHSYSSVRELARSKSLLDGTAESSMSTVRRSAPLTTVLEHGAAAPSPAGKPPAGPRSPSATSSMAERTASFVTPAGQLRAHAARSASPLGTSTLALRPPATPQRKPWNLSSSCEGTALLSASLSRGRVPRLQSDGFGAHDMRLAAAEFLQTQSAHMRQVSGRQERLRARSEHSEYLG